MSKMYTLSFMSYYIRILDENTDKRLEKQKKIIPINDSERINYEGFSSKEGGYVHINSELYLALDTTLTIHEQYDKNKVLYHYGPDMCYNNYLNLIGEVKPI